MVAGLLVYGSVEDALDGATHWTARGPVHAVRVVEPDPDDPRRTRFPTDTPAHLVIEKAIRRLHDEQGVRVFNLSVTDDVPYSGPHVSVWTERLDELARELDVVIVVAAGNHRPSDLPDDTDLIGAYPAFLLGDRARVAEPAVAANVLTVGGVAHSDASQLHDGTSRPGDRAVAPAGHPSPFTRSGPGAGGAIKPDVVHSGGNWVLDDASRCREDDHGVSVVSLARRDGRLFAVANGTSFAAPPVARLAARVLDRYPGATANLVRALIGAASTPLEVPASLDADDVRRVAGYGRPSERHVLESGRKRVAMTFEGAIAADTATIHPIPIPSVFARGRSARRITVALAFDPEVRRTRRDYLGGRINIDLVRAMDPDDIAEAWKSQPTERELREELPQGRQRPTLIPKSNASRYSTLQVRTFDTKRLDVDDGDTYYVVLSHYSASWPTEMADQRYALVVALEDREREDIDLHALVEAQLRSRVRVRG